MARIVRSFSFQPEDRDLLARARARVQGVFPNANESEVIRLALEVLLCAPLDVVKGGASLIPRVARGRPRLWPPITSREVSEEWQRELFLDSERMERFRLLEELTRLEREEPKDETTKTRIEEIRAYFGMK